MNTTSQYLWERTLQCNRYVAIYVVIAIQWAYANYETMYRLESVYTLNVEYKQRFAIQFIC